MTEDFDEEKIAHHLHDQAVSICAEVIDKVRRVEEPLQKVLAMLVIGRLLGTAYSTSASRDGAKAGMDWASNVLLIAEENARELGENIHFMVVRKDS